MNKKETGWAILATLVLFALLACSLLYGAAGFLDLRDPSMRSILMNLRLPRALGGMLAGIGLSLSGALIQKIFHNSLASPNLIGINSSVGFFSLLAGIVFPLSFSASMLAGFAGGMLCSTLVLLMVYKKRASKLTVLLAGMAISQLFSAGMDLLTILSDDALSSLATFKIGTLASLTLSKDAGAALLILPAALCVFLFSHQLELFALGDLQAQALGLALRKWTLIFLALSSLMACGVVSLCGMLGFVGLIVPAWLSRFHLPIKGYLYICAILGAALVTGADLIGRIVVLPWELPAGLILSLTGGPYFLYLLAGRKHHEA